MGSGQVVGAQGAPRPTGSEWGGSAPSLHACGFSPAAFSSLGGGVEQARVGSKQQGVGGWQGERGGVCQARTLGGGRANRGEDTGGRMITMMDRGFHAG